MVEESKYSARRHRRHSGYSLIEVMVSLVVLSFGLLTLATMQIQALKQGKAGRHTSAASATARSYIEQMQRVDWAVLTAAVAAGADSNVFWTNAPDTVSTSIDTGAGVAAHTEHTYDVRWTVTDVTTCLRDVEVKVLWDEEGMVGQKSLAVATRRYNWGAPGC